LSNISGVNVNYIIYKTISQYPEQVDRVQEAADILEKLPFVWKQAASMNVDKYLAYANRWLVQEVGFDTNSRANPCLLVIDYIKPAPDGSGNKKAWEQLGETAGKIKDFASKNFVPIIMPVQLNRQATQGPRGQGTTVAGSDEILRYVDTLWELSLKTDTEIAHDNTDAGRDFGNMCLVQTATRNAAPMGEGNYISLNLDTNHMICIECGKKSDIKKKKYEEKKNRKQRDDNNGEVPL